MLLQELTHRVKNSLQFIASMVMLEARSNDSGEAKARLRGLATHHSPWAALFKVKQSRHR